MISDCPAHGSAQFKVYKCIPLSLFANNLKLDQDWRLVRSALGTKRSFGYEMVVTFFPQTCDTVIIEGNKISS